MASGAGQPFRVSGSATLAAGTLSAPVALAGTGDTVLVTNTTLSLAYVALGATALVTADTSCVPVLPASHLLLGGARLATHAAAVLASGSGNVVFTLGDGSVV